MPSRGILGKYLLGNHEPRALQPSLWLDRYGDLLYRYAYLRLHESSLAEDLVQETLLSAWQHRDRFEQRSSEKTWLIGILKHKIADQYRKLSRTAAVSVEEATDRPADSDSGDRLFFDASGHWAEDIKSWGRDPLTETEATAFWETLNRCLNQLPRLQRDAFTLNELEPSSGEEIHVILGIKTSHLYVLLHRARLSIRRCLETLWFGERES